MAPRMFLRMVSTMDSGYFMIRNRIAPITRRMIMCIMVTVSFFRVYYILVVVCVVVVPLLGPRYATML